jgi:hypothetical protein
MICTANQDGLMVHGIQNGKRYLVKKKSHGWWIEPVSPMRHRVRQVTHAKLDLSDHLDALATEGFSFAPEKKENVSL